MLHQPLTLHNFCSASDSQKLCYRKPIFNQLHIDDLFFTSTISPSNLTNEVLARFVIRVRLSKVHTMLLLNVEQCHKYSERLLAIHHSVGPVHEPTHFLMCFRLTALLGCVYCRHLGFLMIFLETSQMQV